MLPERNTMKLTLNEAAMESGKAKSTISKAIKSGKLSAEKNEDGSFSIDPSELFRVYPKTPKANSEQKNVTRRKPPKTANENSLVANELAKIEIEKSSLLEQKRLLETQLEETRQERDEWREQAKRQTLLLEKKTDETPAKKRRWLFG